MGILRVVLAGFVAVVGGGMICACQTQDRDGNLGWVRSIAEERGIRLGPESDAPKALLAKMRREAQRRFELGVANVSNARTAGYRRVMVLPVVGIGDEHFDRDMSQGSPISSNGPLDLFINGEGFFKVCNEKTKEEAYVRAGMMGMNSRGMLITRDSYLVQPALSLPEGVSALNISSDGDVWGLLAGGTGTSKIGQIQLAMFRDATKLETVDGVFFRPTKESGEARLCKPGTDGAGNIRQGYLEASNVDMTTEMATLMWSLHWVEVLDKAMALAK